MSLKIIIITICEKYFKKKIEIQMLHVCCDLYFELNKLQKGEYFR